MASVQTVTTLQKMQSLGQGIWLDNIRRALITSGELKRLIDQGLTGLTSNPTIFEKAVTTDTEYDDILLQWARTGRSAQETYEALAVADIQAAADLLRPVFDRTHGGDGYASIEVSAAPADNTAAILDEAHRLHSAVSRPNVMIKVPGTSGGIPAIRTLIGEGINVNVTLLFSLQTHKLVMDAYLDGLEDLLARGGDLSHVASVASIFLSRIDTMVDRMLEERIAAGQAELRPLLGKAAVSVAKAAYQNFKATFLESPRFQALAAQGARVQRPLWASTGTKNPAYDDLHYVSPLIGPHTVNTMPPATLAVLFAHGRVEPTLEDGVPDAQETLDRLKSAGIDMEEVASRLRTEGVEAFDKSFRALLDNIAQKQGRLAAASQPPADGYGGPYGGQVQEALRALDAKQAVKRLWEHDFTLWSDRPTEITDRLDWLTVTDTMRDHLDDLRGFAELVRRAGYTRVVLLGMGGSSLGPEVLHQVFGTADGFLELTVLDSTNPAWIDAVTRSLDPARTLFLVSSKSGSTIEPMCLYRHFRQLVEDLVDPATAGEHFAAITDPGTPLEQLAHQDGFRATFLNPPGIGGRYSVLSYFGLVPAVLQGTAIEQIIDRADRMRARCAMGMPAPENPGLWLGTWVGSHALLGRDKLTLVTSPSLASFGLWAEQLIAESLGKGGKGIVPVAGEPLLGAGEYGSDRCFAYLRLEEDNNAVNDAAIAHLAAAGQPVIRLDLDERYDIGGEFFRWEFATAIMGALLEVHPFDQPDVQSAKDATERLLRAYRGSGTLPEATAPPAIVDLLGGARPGDYLAIMAYLQPTGEIERELKALRYQVLHRYRIATTLGYGPRFLHSTGQLHKGGPDSGIFLQLVAQHPVDVPIPGEPYTFATLSDAQALGDLQALQSRGRRVAQVRLGADVAASLQRLVESLG